MDLRSKRKTCCKCLQRLSGEHFQIHNGDLSLWCKQCITRYSRQYASANRHKLRAHKAVRDAVKRGDIIKPATCSLCGDGGRIEGHHSDYTKKLDVTWLCVGCHRTIHTEEKKAEVCHGS